MFETEEKTNVVKEAMGPAMDIVEAAASKSDKSTVAVVGFGLGLAAAAALIVGGIKFGIDTYKEHQSKKELRKPEKTVEPTLEQLDEVAK